MTAPASLYVSPFAPNPSGIGCEQRAFRNLCALTTLGPTDLVLVEPAAARLPGAVRAMVRRVVSLPRAIPPVTRIDALLRDAELLRVPAPGQVAPAAAALDAEPPDLVFVTALTGASAFRGLVAAWPALAALPRVIDLDDVESIFALRSFLHLQTPGLTWPWRLKRLLSAWRYRRAERALVRDWDRVLLCSTRDIERPHLRSPRTLAMPNTVEMPPPGAARVGARGARLLFVGSLGFGPNRSGLMRFAKEVWPLLEGQVALDIVGRDPPEEVQALGRLPGIRVVGPVESVAPWYAGAAAAIAPIYFGGGTRIKIIEALALGCPVISTSIGAEGLDLVPGEHLLIADRPADFAAAIRRLLAEPDLAARLAAAGEARVRALYSAEAGVARLAEMLRGVLAGPRRPA
jgi:hypothetical protein